MKRMIALIAAILFITSSALAEDQQSSAIDKVYCALPLPQSTTVKLQEPVALPQPTDRLHFLGFRFSLGVPTGAALELEASPMKWWHLSLGGSYAGLGPAIVGEVGIDPIDFSIGPTLNFMTGGSFPGHLPGVSQMPDVSYQFEELLVGFRLGKRNHAGFFLEGGPVWMQVQTNNFQSFLQSQSTNLNGILIGNPSAAISAFGAGRLGFYVMF